MRHGILFQKCLKCNLQILRGNAEEVMKMIVDSGGHPFMTSTKNDQFCNPLPHPQKQTIDQTNT